MIKVFAKPLVSNINLPTVIKTAIPPNKNTEHIFIATQVGEIYQIGDNDIKLFLDLKNRVLKLGTNNGYDERGLLGLALHPNFQNNGLFYLHYSVVGSQGPGALTRRFEPDPCNLETLSLKWLSRDTNFDHIDTLEEWKCDINQNIAKTRTILNIRRPFFNHNGVNSLNFSPETNNLVLTTGDGGAGYDPFNLSQNDNEIAGKIIEIDVSNTFSSSNEVVTQFSKLPLTIKNSIRVIAKGIRNIPGITYQKVNNSFIKYVGNVGQDLVESIFAFEESEKVVNLGWRGWEGDFPTSIISNCNKNNLNRKTISYYQEALNLNEIRLRPLISYFHESNQKFRGTALTGVQVYIGNNIPELKDKVLFIDFMNKNERPPKGYLGYASLNNHNYEEIEIENLEGPSFFVSLGTNINQDKIYLGVNSTPNVTDLKKGTVYELIQK